MKCAVLVYHCVEGSDQGYLEDCTNYIDRVVLLKKIQSEGNTQDLDSYIGRNADKAAIVFLVEASHFS